jgi:hypothetical protein
LLNSKEYGNTHRFLSEVYEINNMKKLGVSKVVSVERKPLTGCPSTGESNCGINYRAS